MEILKVLEGFEEECRYVLGLSECTITKYGDGVRLFVNRTGITDLLAVKPDDVRDHLVAGRRDFGWAASTYRTRLNSLRRFFSWCVDSGKLQATPIGKLAKPRLPKRIPRSLSRIEAQHLLECVAGHRYPTRFLGARNYAIVATLVYAGLRRAELLGLAMDDVDLVRGLVTVRAGKGDKDRVVPVSDALAVSREGYLVERRKRGSQCDSFFVSGGKDRPFTEDGLRHTVRVMQDLSGVKFSPHVLRHTFATLMIEGGSEIYGLSRLMGHSDIRTTTIYLSASTDHLRAQVGCHALVSAGP